MEDTPTNPSTLRTPLWLTVLLWIVAVGLMMGAAMYQEATGPTKELRGQFQIGGEIYDYELIRSQETTRGAPIAVPNPGEFVTAHVFYKRLNTDDPFIPIPMALDGGELVGILPVQPAAGKLEYYVQLQSREEQLRIPAEGQEPVVIRYKDPVSIPVLIAHIFFMFFGVLLGIRTGLGALFATTGTRRLAWVTLFLITIGGMILGPVVQKQAFGALWTGFPWGYDLTDNKTLIMWIVWVGAVGVLGLKVNRERGWKGRVAILLASVVMTAVYLIPHSLRGSELDYSQIDQGVPAEEAVTTGRSG